MKKQKNKKNKLLAFYFFGGTLVLFIAVLLFANNDLWQLKTESYSIGELMSTEGWDWNTMTTSDSNYQDASYNGVSMYRDESGSSYGVGVGESSGTLESNVEKGTVLGAEGDVEKVVCDGSTDCYAESYFLKDGMQNVGSFVKDENGNYVSGYVDEDLVNTLIDKGYNVSWQDYELVVGYTGCTGQCYDSSGLHESDGEFEYFVRDYKITDSQTGEELDLDLTSTGGVTGYQYWEATDSDGEVLMEIGLSGNDLENNSTITNYNGNNQASFEDNTDYGAKATSLRTSSGLSSRSTVTDAMGSSSQKITNNSDSKNTSAAISSSNNSDQASLLTAKAIADDETKLDLSDVSELEKSYLGISGKTGVDLNGDDIFSYADVVTLVRLYLNEK
jgi:hypothetical protein